MLSRPAKLPAARGAKPTVIVQVCPAARVAQVFGAVKPAGGCTAVISTGSGPGLVTVTGCVVVLPRPWKPKSMPAAGATVSWPRGGSPHVVVDQPRSPTPRVRLNPSSQTCTPAAPSPVATTRRNVAAPGDWICTADVPAPVMATRSTVTPVMLLP